MSVQADQQRSQRQKFAAPGGSHDRLIRALRVVLPSIIGAVLALLLFSPFANDRELSFVLAKDGVDMAGERLKVADALYRGKDSKGRPFALRAGSAVQQNSNKPILKMHNVRGQLQMDKGLARIEAANGIYNMDTEVIRTIGPLAFTDGNGFNLTASNVALTMKSRKLESFGPASGSTRVGTFNAGKLRADLNARIVRLEGGARLQINQGALK
jgi:lipopolysaccharide export system protein LptC